MGSPRLSRPADCGSPSRDVVGPTRGPGVTSPHTAHGPCPGPLADCSCGLGPRIESGADRSRHPGAQTRRWPAPRAAVKPFPSLLLRFCLHGICHRVLFPESFLVTCPLLNSESTTPEAPGRLPRQTHFPGGGLNAHVPAATPALAPCPGTHRAGAPEVWHVRVSSRWLGC